MRMNAGIWPGRYTVEAGMENQMIKRDWNEFLRKNVTIFNISIPTIKA